MENTTKITKNKREKTIAFTYVSLWFLLATVICCWCLFYYVDFKSETQKKFVITKMNRIRLFQEVQSDQMVIVDSIYNKIKEFNPAINASYEENDIKFYLTEIKNLYNRNNYDGRYKIFLQTSKFYDMWFADKKILWSKQQNIAYFKKNLEECQIGLDKKIDELKNSKK